MRITADANVLIRAIIEDHPAQTATARAALNNAERIAIPIPALCEFVWVLGRVYRKRPLEIATAVRVLLSDTKVDVDVSATEAGLAMLDAGGGFADGVIAFEGRRLGGDVFTTFDRKAANLLETAGHTANLLQAE